MAKRPDRMYSELRSDTSLRDMMKKARKERTKKEANKARRSTTPFSSDGGSPTSAEKKARMSLPDRGVKNLTPLKALKRPDYLDEPIEKMPKADTSGIKKIKKKKKKVVRTIPLLPKITKKKPPRIIRKEKATAKAKGVLKRMGKSMGANKGTAKDIKGYYKKATKYPKEMKEQKD